MNMYLTASSEDFFPYTEVSQHYSTEVSEYIETEFTFLIMSYEVT